MKTETFNSSSPEETCALAAKWGALLVPGDCVALCGDLGAGKTTFVQGLFAGLGGDSHYQVTSPTYTLLHEYPVKKGDLIHLDLYRLESFAEVDELDLDVTLGQKGILVIEWGDKFPELAEMLTYKIMFVETGEDRRTITITKIKREW